MRCPELNQQPVQVLPLLANRFSKRMREDVSIVQDDPFKVLGFDSLERRGDPSDV